MVKITFIEAPLTAYKPSPCIKTSLPLLWMLTLMTYLKNRMGKNVSFRVLDGTILDLGQILKKLKKSDIVAISPKFHTYAGALIIARAAKKIGSRIVMGGPHASFLAKEILSNRGPASKDYCVDAVVKGDGEKAFYEYVAEKNLSEIKNLVFAKSNGIIAENPLEYLDINRLPRINRKLINPKRYFKSKSGLRPKHFPVFPVYTHRGCFCGNFNSEGCFSCGVDKKFRARDPRDFWQEVDELVKEFKATHVVNLADGLPISNTIPWCREFYKASFLCKKKPTLFIRTLPHFINREAVRILKALNVKRVRMPITDVFPGCAVGSLAGLTKNDLSRIYQPFKLLDEGGISVVTYFNLGISEGTEKDIKKIHEFSRKLLAMKKVKIIFARGYMPAPSSKAWRMILEENGEKYKNKDLIDWREFVQDCVKNFSDINLLPKLAELEKSILSAYGG